MLDLRLLDDILDAVYHIHCNISSNNDALDHLLVGYLIHQIIYAIQTLSNK